MDILAIIGTGFASGIVGCLFVLLLIRIANHLVDSFPGIESGSGEGPRQ